VRFLSLEPLLEDLNVLDLDGIDWVIVGGESGPNARPMQPAWPRAIRDQCAAAAVPFFFKQWGEWVPEGEGAFPVPLSGAETRYVEASPERGRLVMARIGKKVAGAELDGRTWLEMPVRAVKEALDVEIRPDHGDLSRPMEAK